MEEVFRNIIAFVVCVCVVVGIIMLLTPVLEIIVALFAPLAVIFAPLIMILTAIVGCVTLPVLFVGGIIGLVWLIIAKMF